MHSLGHHDIHLLLTIDMHDGLLTQPRLVMENMKVLLEEVSKWTQTEVKGFTIIPTLLTAFHQWSSLLVGHNDQRY